jgi:hypothetical protein
METALADSIIVLIVQVVLYLAPINIFNRYLRAGEVDLRRIDQTRKRLL